MLHIALCDDNLQFLTYFEEMIKNELPTAFPTVTDNAKITLFSSGEELLSYMEDSVVDVFFLDIDMPKMSGFDLAKVLANRTAKPLIIFTSGYDNFVYSCFDFSPFAFIRKSCLEQELPRVLERIANSASDALRQVTLCTRASEYISLRIKDILYFESKQNYYTVRCTDGTEHECRGTLSQAEDFVSEYDFYRIHSAFLVNMEYVDRVVDHYFISMKGFEVPVAQKRMAEFRKKYAEYVRRRYNL